MGKRHMVMVAIYIDGCESTDAVEAAVRDAIPGGLKYRVHEIADVTPVRVVDELVAHGTRGAAGFGSTGSR